MLQKSPAAAYVHLPFCRRRCYYCDFAISVVGDRDLTENSTMVVDYVDYLQREIQLTPASNTPLKSIFFGGGTPSLLPVEKLAAILSTIRQQFSLSQDVEISMEIDPGTFNHQKLQNYLDLGINRFSLGVQTFDDSLLKACGRSHTVGDIYSAIDIIQKSDVNNWSLDLITGLPHQTLPQVEHSLKNAIETAPHHLSCYDLVLEPVTAFGKQYHLGEQPLPTDEDAATMYRLTQEILTNGGYEHYEISNYAQPGFQSRHNRVYWENQTYYGFGMSAASYLDGKRYTRPRTRREYYTWVQNGAIIDTPQISKSDRLLETLMLGLRLTTGVNLSHIRQDFGEETVNQILNCVKNYQSQNLVEVTHTKQQFQLRLTDPHGFLLSNTILASLFEQLS